MKRTTTTMMKIMTTTIVTTTIKKKSHSYSATRHRQSYNRWTEIYRYRQTDIDRDHPFESIWLRYDRSSDQDNSLLNNNNNNKNDVLWLPVSLGQKTLESVYKISTSDIFPRNSSQGVLWTSIYLHRFC